MQENNKTTVSLYVVKGVDGTFFAGFDASKGKSSFVAEAIAAKKFTNKYDIKLRPEESLVELSVDLSNSPVTISEPFRPHRRIVKQVAQFTFSAM